MANIIMIKHGEKKPTVANLNDFELGYSINEQKLYIKEVKNGVATLRSFSIDEKLATKDSVTTLNNELGTLKHLLNPTAAGAFYATGANTTPVFGTLPIASGGTGITTNPSMLVKLNSTSPDTVFEAKPRPGVTGILPVKNGGTGLKEITSGSFLVGGENNTITLTTASDVLSLIGAAPSSHKHSASNITSGTLSVKRGGTGLSTITSGSFLVGNGTSAIALKTASEVLSLIGAAASSHNHSASNITSGTLSVAFGGTGVTQKYTDGTITWTSNVKTTAGESTGPILRYYPYLGLVFVQLDFRLATTLNKNTWYNIATSSFLPKTICSLACYGTATASSNSYGYDLSASILTNGNIRICNAGSGSASASYSPRVYVTGFFAYDGT